MTLPVFFTPKALQDLEGIHGFIAEDNSKRADSYLAELVDACEKLGTMPEMGRKRDDLGYGRRSFSFNKRHTILYAPRDGRLDIIRVFSSGQDIFDVLGKY